MRRAWPEDYLENEGRGGGCDNGGSERIWFFWSCMDIWLWILIHGWKTLLMRSKTHDTNSVVVENNDCSGGKKRPWFIEEKALLSTKLGWDFHRNEFFTAPDEEKIILGRQIYPQLSPWKPISLGLNYQMGRGNHAVARFSCLDVVLELDR